MSLSGIVEVISMNPPASVVSLPQIFQPKFRIFRFHGSLRLMD